MGAGRALGYAGWCLVIMIPERCNVTATLLHCGSLLPAELVRVSHAVIKCVTFLDGSNLVGVLWVPVIVEECSRC